MFFEGIDEKEMERLERVGTLSKYHKDEAILKEGEAGTSFSIILKGRVEVRKNLIDGSYKALVELGVFDLIGELGFFGVATRSASVIALEDTDMLEFSRPDFERFVEERPKIGWKIYRNMARILADRLASNDANLMDTIIWALGQPRDAKPRPAIDLREKQKLRVGEKGKI